MNVRQKFSKFSNLNFVVLQMKDERSLIPKVESTVKAAVIGKWRWCDTVDPSSLDERLLHHNFSFMRFVRLPMSL